MEKRLSKYLAAFLAVLIAFSGVSCKDFLTVNPDNDGSDYILYTDTEGFVEALVGVYTVARRGNYSPVDGAFFGGYAAMDYADILRLIDGAASDFEYDFTQYVHQEKGLFEYMSCFWPVANRQSLEYKEGQLYLHRYDSEKIKKNVLDFFRSQYEIVTNANLILQWIDAGEQDFLSQRDYSIIKGEALGMRAFALFDLIRAFGPPPTATDLHSEEYIPYPKDLRTTSYPRETYARFMEYVVDDLEQAAAHMRDHDPVLSQPMSALKQYPSAHLADAWLLNRHARMNYLAVQALRARVCQWIGGEENRTLAFDLAKEVIGAEVIGEKSFSFNATSDYDRQRMVIPENEMIFGLPSQKPTTEFVYTGIGISPNVKSFAVGGSSGSFIDQHLARVFTGAEGGLSVTGDVRYSRQFHTTTGNMGSQHKHPVKFAPFSNTANMNLVPVIRLSEMYLIAADCAPTDAESASYLTDLLRAKRTDSPAPISYNGNRTQWILTQYAAEFWGEGQLWFCYKRLGLDTIPFAYYGTAPAVYYQGFAGPVPMNSDAYMLPIPWEEIAASN